MSNATEKPWKRLATAMTGARWTDEFNSDGSVELSQNEISLLSAIPGCVSLHNRDGSIVWASSKLKVLFEVSEENDFQDFYFTDMNPQDRVVVANAMSETLEWSEERQVQFKRQNQNDSQSKRVRVFEMECAPYTSSKTGQAKSLVLAMTRETTQTFEKLGELKEQLRQSEVERVERNRFFSSMSHELRTPLNAIIGFSELLEGKAAIQINDAKKLEYASVINESATHLLSLINDVLDLSKLEEGKQEKIIDELSIRELLQTTVRTMMPVAMSKQIDLVLDCDGELPAINSDSRVLRQIFTNLVSNAVKFSDNGDEVRIKVTRLRNRYKISVIDYGMGMNAETLSRLGGVFYQSGDVVRGNYEGSGLGMAIVFKLVELVDGKIAINSKPDMGTTVSVILPTGTASATPVPSAGETDVVYLHQPENSELVSTSEVNKVTGVS